MGKGIEDSNTDDDLISVNNAESTAYKKVNLLSKGLNEALYNINKQAEFPRQGFTKETPIHNVKHLYDLQDTNIDSSRNSSSINDGLNKALENINQQHDVKQQTTDLQLAKDLENIRMKLFHNMSLKHLAQETLANKNSTLISKEPKNKFAGNKNILCR